MKSKRSEKNFIEVALRLLEGEYAARRLESALGENMPGAKKREPVLDDRALREWNNLVIQASLALMSKGVQTHDKEFHEIRDHLSILMRLLPEIEKLNPALVANLKQSFSQLLPKIEPKDRIRLETANAKAEDILALAMKSQGDLRTGYLARAVRKALDSEGNFEFARKIAEEHITDPEERNALMEQIEEKEKQYSLEHGKIEEVAASMTSLESDADRAGKLADLTGRALKSDRSIGLADRIRQPELKLHMKLLAIQSATSE
jgi:hypothetical protein